MAPTKSCGQTALRSRASSVMPNAQSPSIVQCPIHRAITGRALGITVHQHHGYRVHYGWNGAFGNRCFERRFPSYNSLSHVCVTMINGAPVGLCCCIMILEGIHGYRGPVLGHVFDLMSSKMEVCGRGCSLTFRRGWTGHGGPSRKKWSGRKRSRSSNPAIVPFPPQRPLSFINSTHNMFLVLLLIRCTACLSHTPAPTFHV